MPLKPGDLFDLAQTSHAELFDGCAWAWEALPRLPAYVRSHTRHPTHGHTAIGSVYVGDNVVIGEGTVIENGATVKGGNVPYAPGRPAIIGKDCRIGPGAYIRENSIIGDGCIVGNSVETKHCLLFNGCQVPHYNYVGDSILGHKAHLGAGATCSNWKLMPSPVEVEVDGERVNTGLMKFGALLGDRAEVGCNAVLNPGSVLGRDSVVYAGLAWRGVLPARKIAKGELRCTVVDRRD